MTRLPPAEKLPLALRKNIRDYWEAKKEGHEKDLSARLGTAWTIDIDPKAIYPYGDSDWAKESLGQLICSYVSGALYQLERFQSQMGEEGVEELNKAASAHVLTLDVDETGANAYCGVTISKDGKLVILFNEKNLGSNDNEALEPEKLAKALNEAETKTGGQEAEALSFKARNGIRNDYDSKAAKTQAAISALFPDKDIKLVPNFEGAAAKLRAAAASNSSIRSDWEDVLGSFTLEYFDGVQSTLEYKGFGKDDMLQEGFSEAVDTGIIEFRLVDSLEKASYCEVVIEDSKLYVQTTAERWGSNIRDAAEGIIDLL